MEESGRIKGKIQGTDKQSATRDGCVLRMAVQIIRLYRQVTDAFSIKMDKQGNHR